MMRFYCFGCLTFKLENEFDMKDLTDCNVENKRLCKGCKNSLKIQRFEKPIYEDKKLEGWYPK